MKSIYFLSAFLFVNFASASDSFVPVCKRTKVVRDAILRETHQNKCEYVQEELKSLSISQDSEISEYPADLLDPMPNLAFIEVGGPFLNLIPERFFAKTKTLQFISIDQGTPLSRTWRM
jgi:hypothetical protein